MDNTRQERPGVSPPSNDAKRKIPWRKVFVFVAIFLLVAVAVLAILCLTVFKHSKDQTDNIPIFRLDSTNVTVLELSSSELSATWDIGFSVQNPTAASVLYQRMDLSLYYRQERLATTTLASFLSEGGQTWKPVKAKLETSSANGTAAEAPSDLGAEMASGSATFSLGLYAGYYIGGESPKRVWSAVEAFAYNVNIAFSAGGRKGTLVGGEEMWKITARW